MSDPQAPPLVDGFGRAHTYLRIAVTDRCNLRCMYCMPAEGIDPMDGGVLLTDDEIVRIAALMARRGVTRIRLTGGEPLARRGLPALVARLASIRGIELVGMTTNGTLLARDARALRAAGLRRVNISLDTLRPDRFARITLRARHADVLAGIDAALALGFERVKINTVVMRGINDDELDAFVEFARTRDVTVRFIEYMPFASNGWKRAGCVPWAEMRAVIEARHELVPVGGGPSDVAKEFRIPGMLGRIGCIPSVSEHFCGSCNRLRLTADGALKSCLFLSAESDLRTPLRAGADDRDLDARIDALLRGKPWAHDAADALAAHPGRSMIHIGG